MGDCTALAVIEQPALPAELTATLDSRPTSPRPARHRLDLRLLVPRAGAERAIGLRCNRGGSHARCSCRRYWRPL